MTAAHCSTLQYTATLYIAAPYCNNLHRRLRQGQEQTHWLKHTARHCKTLQHTATHCDTLQHTATHYNTLQHAVAYGDTLQHTATYCDTLRHTAKHFSTLRHTATRCDILRHTATYCKTLQHTATHRNTLQHTATHCSTLTSGTNIRTHQPEARAVTAHQTPSCNTRYLLHFCSLSFSFSLNHFFRFLQISLQVIRFDMTYVYAICDDDADVDADACVLMQGRW